MKHKLFFVIPILLSLNVNAQDSLSISSEIKTEAIVMKMERELKLDFKQQQRITDILNRHWEKVSDARANGDRDKISSIRQKTRNRLRNVMEDEQFAKFKELRQSSIRLKEEFALTHPEYAFSDLDKDLDL